MYHEQIRELDARYQEIKGLIESAANNATIDNTRLQALRREQSQITQQLSQLRRAQWEADHDSFDMDPDL